MEEFKKFIAKGNVAEMAVGLIMATYFGAIVKSLVNDILMPPIGMLLGGVDFSRLKIIIQYAVFLFIKGYNKIKERFEKKEEEAPAAPPEPSKEELLLTEIRDLLKK